MSDAGPFPADNAPPDTIDRRIGKPVSSFALML